MGTHEPFAADDFAEIGFSHYLRKPFESQDIIRMITDMLGQPLPSKEPTISGNPTPFAGKAAGSVSSHPVIAIDLSNDAQMEGSAITRMQIPLPEDMSAEMMAPPPPPP